MSAQVARVAQAGQGEAAPFGRLRVGAPDTDRREERLARRVSSGWLTGALLVMVTLSGVSGLMYQVLWVRSLSLTFGVTTIAVTAVLAGFMAGLALGSFVAGRAADRVAQPLVLYGLIEIGIGVFGVLSPRAFAALPELYRWLPQGVNGESDAVGTAIRVALAFLIILVPTTLMGATLPVVVKSSLVRSGRLHRDVSWLYAANTSGAIVGTVAAGFVLIGGYGMGVTALVAGGLNLMAGVMALVLSGFAGSARARQVDAALPLHPLADSSKASLAALAQPPSLLDRREARFAWAVAWVYALSGFCALAYEVVWNRVLSLFFDGTTYPFTIMLATVLAGIALGSYAVSPLLERRWNWGLVFAVVQLGLGLSVTAALGVFGELHAIGRWVAAVELPVPLAHEDQVALVACLLTIFPAAFLMGVGFPVATRLYARHAEAAGRQVGGIYAANVTGAIFGSFVAGFVLIPRLGSQGTLVALAGLNVALGLVLLALLHRPAAPARIGLGVAAAVGLAVLAWSAPDLRTRLLPRAQEGGKLLWHAEDKAATVTVVEMPTGGGGQGQGAERMLYVNSRPQASDAYGAAQLHQLLGHFPMLLHRAPRDVLVVGLGGGATPGAVALHRDSRVDVVELVPNVIRAAPQLSHINGDVLNRPNVRVIEDDGRNFLLRAVHGGRRYDVITADIIRPHHAGAGNLYSVEYYRLAAAALKEDGIMMQWFDPSPMHRHQLLLRTFMEAFPYTSLWLNGDLVIGSKQPLALTPERLSQRVRESGVPAGVLERLAIPQGHELVGHWFLARDEELRRYVGPGEVLSDDRPAVEYFRSLEGEDVPLDIRRFSRRN